VITPPKPRPGDRVSVVSPSWAGPEHFPRVHDLGLERLRGFGLEPVELPTTRRQGTPQERARDLMAAFTDPTTTAVLATIGGDDQLTVLPFLDDEVLRAHPKPFFGWSDNTNLLVRLWNLGIVSYHGGSTMVHLGRPGRMHPVTEASLRAALFTTGPWQLPAPTETGDEDGDWATDDLAVERPLRPAEPWTWHGGSSAVTGTLWGGNVEILAWTMGVGHDILPLDRYAGCVLLLETSEELPGAEEVFRALRVMGERGLLGQFAGVAVGRPKAWSRDRPVDRAAYTADQRDAVLRALATYNPTATVVVGLDAGHTDPQVVLPIGGEVTLDPAAGTVTVTY
jgi:muramoyltetrapeptide carboxypeptidase LdcA involved in peptidoglycan recycling